MKLKVNQTLPTQIKCFLYINHEEDLRKQVEVAFQMDVFLHPVLPIESKRTIWEKECIKLGIKEIVILLLKRVMTIMVMLELKAAKTSHHKNIFRVLILMK